MTDEAVFFALTDVYRQLSEALERLREAEERAEKASAEAVHANGKWTEYWQQANQLEAEVERLRAALAEARSPQSDLVREGVQAQARYAGRVAQLEAELAEAKRYAL